MYTWLALGMPDRASWLILLGFLAAFTVLVWLSARLIRSQGGVRGACRRIVWEVRMTRRAFAEPFRVFSRHRRWARILSGYLADPAAPGRALAALDHADSTADNGCYALAVQLNPARDRVRVILAGRDPLAPAGPWERTAADPGEWTWSAQAASVEAPEGPERLLLALGVDRRLPGAVLVDWLRGPAALAVEGDPPAARGMVQALAAQIDQLPDGPPVLVARGVHPRHHGSELDALLDELESDRSAEAPVTPVVVCWSPTPEQSARLSELTAAGRLRALVGGRFPGACWTLHLEPGGRLLAPGLHLDLESAALPRAIARSIRRGRRRPPAGTVLPGPGAAVRDAVPAAGPRTDAAVPRARDVPDEGAARPHGALTEADFAADFAEPAPAPARPAAQPAPAPTPVPRPRVEPDFAEPAPAEPDERPGPARERPSPAADITEKPERTEKAQPAGTAEPAPAPAEVPEDDGDLAEPAPAAPPTRSVGGVSAASGTTDERTSSQP
ncbi:hypothetical protein [Streptomyces lonegramiae]|uniref:Type VII secretion protein EccE n=1 Tax=Streptomyces lonegramiae TaxID=3075524 RepID=A0ABU2XAA9_9ACTN|nr:hypothetical protein [Streptomyces sp. DSM 41529]MDT0542854.1 hypothetical protein [Streptomyces sp. DSM 41529]